MRETTEIRLDEYGGETHESWVVIRANRVMCERGGARLFDSEIAHQHIIMVEASRCSRRRDLNRDRLHDTKLLFRLEMSQAQWGAFVSSFGHGVGVPATLRWLTGAGDVPEAPVESRLGESVKDVRESGDEAFAKVQEDFAAVEAAFESGGRKALREAIHSLHYTIENAPKNMEFAAKSLNEHVENVVTKARADLEAMALAAVERGELPQAASLELTEGGVHDE